MINVAVISRGWTFEIWIVMMVRWLDGLYRKYGVGMNGRLGLERLLGRGVVELKLLASPFSEETSSKYTQI